MTDAERQKLCAYLRMRAEQEYHDAADEMERLAIQNKRLKRVVRVREQRRQNDVGVSE
jgi:hypothetical protein